jgi:hypothetical protein
MIKASGLIITAPRVSQPTYDGRDEESLRGVRQI